MKCNYANEGALIIIHLQHPWLLLGARGSSPAGSSRDPLAGRAQGGTAPQGNLCFWVFGWTKILNINLQWNESTESSLKILIFPSWFWFETAEISGQMCVAPFQREHRQKVSSQFCVLLLLQFQLIMIMFNLQLRLLSGPSLVPVHLHWHPAQWDQLPTMLWVAATDLLLRNVFFFPFLNKLSSFRTEFLNSFQMRK